MQINWEINSFLPRSCSYGIPRDYPKYSSGGSETQLAYSNDIPEPHDGLTQRRGSVGR